MVLCPNPCHIIMSHRGFLVADVKVYVYQSSWNTTFTSANNTERGVFSNQFLIFCMLCTGVEQVHSGHTIKTTTLTCITNSQDTNTRKWLTSFQCDKRPVMKYERVNPCSSPTSCGWRCSVYERVNPCSSPTSCEWRYSARRGRNRAATLILHLQLIA